MIQFSQNKKTDIRLKKYILITSLLSTAFCLFLGLILGINLPVIIFSLTCAPCIGALSGTLVCIAVDYIKD